MTHDFTITGADPDELWPLIRDHHYSGRMPSNIQHCYAIRKAGGLFGDSGQPIAGIIFAIPAAKWSEKLIELSRLVRAPECVVPLTKLISFSIPWLRKSKWALAVSFADWTERHHGGIYQAAGWFYNGQRNPSVDGLIVDGKFVPGRNCNHEWGTRSPSKLKEFLPERSIEPHWDEGKHLYWRPLAVAGRSKANRLGLQRLPYPKPNAAGPVDELLPSSVSFAQPEAAAPTSIGNG